MKSNLTEIWQSVNNYAWHGDLLALLLMVGVITILMLHYRPADRRTLISTLLLFGFGLAGQLASGLVFVAGFPQIASGLHEAFLIFEGLAAIRLFGIFAFRLLLPTLRLMPPRILEDI